MSTINFNSFMAFRKTLEGQTLSTKGGNARFVLVSAKNNRLDYLVVSTQKYRHSTRRWIQAVLDHYALTNSLRPVDYMDVTYNASYTLALMDLYLKQMYTLPNRQSHRQTAKT